MLAYVPEDDESPKTVRIVIEAKLVAKAIRIVRAKTGMDLRGNLAVSYLLQQVKEEEPN